MIAPPNPGWTLERIETLKTLAPTGLSASQIARELGGGLSRNAVIGKAHRMRLSFGKARPLPQTPGHGSVLAKVKAAPIVRARREAKAAKPTLVRVAKSEFVLPRSPATPETIEALAEVRSGATMRFEKAASLALAPRPWEERGFGECKFPIDRDGSIWSCCNAADADYCPAHLPVVFSGYTPKAEIKSARRAAA